MQSSAKQCSNHVAVRRFGILSFFNHTCQIWKCDPIERLHNGSGAGTIRITGTSIALLTDRE